jgi:hypothetical protein
MIKYTFFLVTFITFFVHGQVDFNNYLPLQSKGEITQDFTTRTYDKLAQDLRIGNEDFSYEQEKVFYEGINYAIDDILHSGVVTYGDDLSMYLNKIADRLLENNPTLRQKLRFYTIKSNAPNAFSTAQGIVFVTTGLISHLKNEAQLAFVLAHEITHFEEEHVLESFSYNSDNKKKSLKQMSTYSKGKEFEADEKGLVMYSAAGYSEAEVIPTLDVLMYSHLPFDQVEIPLSYFKNKESTYLPDRLFPNQYYDIAVEEDYDDSKSSHPNIKKRKEALRKHFVLISNWGDAINPLGKELFEEIRNIARFENVRSSILDAEYGNALYSIYLLERDFPNSIYLERMKAQTWLGLLQYGLANKVSYTIQQQTNYEGCSANVHFMIFNLSNDELEAMSIRQVYDAHQKFKEDIEIDLIWKKIIETSVSIGAGSFREYSTMTYSEANIGIQQISNYQNDSINVVSIRGLLKFHHYLLNDVIQDQEFIDLVKKCKVKKNALNEEKLQDSNNMKLGLDRLIVVEPTVRYYKQGELDRVKSEKLDEKFVKAFGIAAKEAGVSIHSISSSDLKTKATLGYNERSAIFNLLGQLSLEQDIKPFPVDFQLLKGIEEKYETSFVMLSFVQSENQLIDGVLAKAALISIMAYPVAFIYPPLLISTRTVTEINFVIIDTSTATVVVDQTVQINDYPRKYILGGHVYNIFSQLNKTR